MEKGKGKRGSLDLNQAYPVSSQITGRGGQSATTDVRPVLASEARRDVGRLKTPKESEDYVRPTTSSVVMPLSGSEALIQAEIDAHQGWVDVYNKTEGIFDPKRGKNSAIDQHEADTVKPPAHMLANNSKKTHRSTRTAILIKPKNRV